MTKQFTLLLFIGLAWGQSLNFKNDDKTIKIDSGEKLQLNFEVPSESLIGFEHFPKSQDQRWYFNEAIKSLLEPSEKSLAF